jgi:hypothetical protein
MTTKQFPLQDGADARIGCFLHSPTAEQHVAQLAAGEFGEQRDHEAALARTAASGASLTATPIITIPLAAFEPGVPAARSATGKPAQTLPRTLRRAARF